MNTKNTHYELPESSDSEIQRMIIILALFFVSLVLVAGLAIFHAQTIAKLIPFSAEQRFIRPYESLIKKHFDFLSGDQQVTNYLQELADDLGKTMQQDQLITAKLHYLDSDDVNAFATLGGHIFVFRGLLETMPDENSLSMVLAHEMAHIHHRDPVAGLSRGLALQLIYSFLTAGSSSEKITDIIANLGLSGFSRKQEKLADLKALHALDAHYGHVGGYDTFFLEQQLSFKDESADEDEWSTDEWFSSHPEIAERLRYLEEEKNNAGKRIEQTVLMPQTIREIIHPVTTE